MHQFIVMNECNQPLFVNPQWDTAGREPVGRRSAAARSPPPTTRSRASAARTSSGASASRRAATTSRTRRATRRPRRSSSSAPSARGSRRSPQKTHRTAPLMDGLDFHPYPVPQSLAVRDGLRRPRATRASRTCRGSTRRSTTGSTARRSGRSASRRAAACRVSLNEMGIQTDAVGQAGYVGTEVERERGRRRGRPVRDRGLPGDLVQADARPRSRATRTCASSTSSTSSTSRTSPAGRAGSTGSARPGPIAEAVGAESSRLARADRRRLPGKPTVPWNAGAADCCRPVRSKVA